MRGGILAILHKEIESIKFEQKASDSKVKPSARCFLTLSERLDVCGKLRAGKTIKGEHDNIPK